MEGLLSALVLLCGLDYAGDNYKSCVARTGACHAKMVKELPMRKAGMPLTEKEKMVFYKCYSEGAVVKRQVALKRK